MLAACLLVSYYLFWLIVLFAIVLLSLLSEVHVFLLVLYLLFVFASVCGLACFGLFSVRACICMLFVLCLFAIAFVEWLHSVFYVHVCVRCVCIMLLCGVDLFVGCVLRDVLLCVLWL